MKPAPDANFSAPPEGRSQPNLIALLLALTCVCALSVSIDPSVMGFIGARIYVIISALAPGFAVALACAGWGDLLVRPGAALLRPAERVVLAFACGLGIISCGAGILGFTGAMNQVTSLVLIGFGLVAGLPLWKSLAIRCTSRTRPWAPAAFSGPQVIVIIIICAVTAALTVFALAPPLIFDVTEYHLGAWSSYTHGSGNAHFIPMPYNFYARFPFPIESVYFLGLSVSPGLDTAPKVINALCVLACGILAAQFIRRCGLARSAPLLGALAVLTLPVMLDVSVDALIDAPVALMICASVFASLLAGGKFAMHAETNSALIVPSVFAFGAALASKYTVAQIYLLPWCVIALPCMVRLPGRAKWKYLAIAVAALPCIIWFGKNIFLYGNPLEPFFGKWFRPDDSMAIAREKFYVESHFPQSPLSAAYWSSLFPRLQEFTWIYLVACAGWFYVPRRGVAIRLLAFSALSWLLWNLVRESPNRFLLPAMVLVTSVAIVGAMSLPGATLRRVAAATLLLFSLVQTTLYALKLRESKAVAYLIDFYPGASDDPAEPDAATPREAFMETNLGHLGEVITSVNHQLPETAKLLLVYEARPYLFRNHVQYNVVWDQSLLLDIIRDAKTADDAWALLRRAGITHVLVNRQELLRYIQQYATKSQLLPLGVTASQDPRLAWSATAHPEDLYPPFYHDPDWDRLRPIVHDLLDRLDKQATIRKGIPASETQAKPLDIIVTAIN